MQQLTLDDSPMFARFLEKVRVNPETGCWDWQGARSTRVNGETTYGNLKLNGRTVSAHQFAYETLIGPVPIGYELDHLCQNKGCANPVHQEPVTHAENVRRGARAAYFRNKTHCPAGHPYNGANLYIDPTGSRRCRACRREGMRLPAREQVPA